MAARKPSSQPTTSSGSRKRSEGAPTSARKLRAEGDAAKARASGGGLRSQPVDEPAGRSASTGGRADSGMVRNSQNSRSSNSGRQRSQKVPRQP
jgi:hypothetical protein